MIGRVESELRQPVGCQVIHNDLIVASSGSLMCGVGDRFLVRGNFLNSSTKNLSWNTASAQLIFDGGGSHRFQLTGRDYGANFSGFSTNFSWGSLDLRLLPRSISQGIRCKADSSLKGFGG